ncbi:MAG: glycosyl hydrolase, partial [Hungatella sp.]
NIVGMAQYNAMRVKWALPIQQPWYVSEVPTMFLSLNFTNHLIDVPMAKTYVNAYMNSDEALYASLEKLMGKSEFKGKYHKNVFCGRWDTAY